MPRPTSDNPRHNRTGGENDIPRSFGKVLKAIRFGLDFTQARMRSELESTPSPFEMHLRKGTKNPGAVINTWESGKENLSFAAQHRYATIAGCYSGVLHLISLFYSRWQKAESEPENRAHCLAESEAVAKGLVALAQFVLSENARIVGMQSASGVPTENAGLQQILRMVDAYCEGARTERATADSVKTASVG